MYKNKKKRKSNNRSFDWYGARQRFSIRKYHFGATSVLLSTVLAISPIIQAEGSISNSGTVARATSNANLISGTFEKGDQNLITGESVADEVRLSVLGTDASYSNIKIQYQIIENGVQGEANITKLSGYKNNTPVYDASNKVYTMTIGDLISGSDVVIPISFNAPNGSVDGTSAKVIMTVLDGDGNVLGQGEKNITWDALSTATINSNLAQNTMGLDDSGVAIGGIRAADGTVLARSVRSYVLSLDEDTKDAIKEITDKSGKNIGTAGSLPKGTVVRVYYNKEYFEALSVGNKKLTQGANQAGRIINQEEGYIEYGISAEGVLNDIEKEIKGFYLVYTGDEENIPDTVLTTKVMNSITGEVLSETSSTHKNVWSSENIPGISNDGVGGLSVNTKIDTGYTDDYATNKYSGINTNNKNTNNSTTNWGTSYLGESIGSTPEKPLATYQNTDFSRSDSSVINFVDKLSVNVAKQVDGDMSDYFTKTVVSIHSVDQLTFSDNKDAVVYYINKDGVRKDLGKLSDYATIIGNGQNNFVINDVVETVGVDFSNTSGAFYQSLSISMIQLSDNMNYKSSDVVSTHSVTDTTISAEDNNDYRYTAQLIGKQSKDVDETVTWKSAYAGYSQEKITINTRIRKRGSDSNNLYVGNKANFTGSLETSRTAGLVNEVPVNESSYVYVAVAQTLQVDNIVPVGGDNSKLSTDKSTYKTETKTIDGQDYIIYKIPFKEGVTSVKPTEGSVNVSYTMSDSYFYGWDSERRTTNIYYGLAFDTVSNFVHTGGADHLDLDGDGNSQDISGPKSIIGSQDSITGISPETLFIYDQSKYKDRYRFDTTEVEAGDSVQIKVNVENRTDASYTDVTVITVLSNSEDEVFNGKSSRGSQFTPKLNGPVVPPTGWKVYYTTDEQDPNESGSELTGWTDTVTDYSTVTAIKLVSNPGVVLAKGDNVLFEYGLDTPSDAKSGQKIITTSAIAINGSSNFLEGYRSTVQIKKTYGSVVVKYVDTDGNTLADDKISMPENTETGTAYDTTSLATKQITKDGKVYSLVPAGTYTVGEVDAQGHLTTSDSISGEVGVGEKVVTYVYKEAKGNVVVKYVDKEGNEIKTPVNDETNVSTGTDYDTTDKIEEKITTQAGKTYKRVPSETKGNETGKVVEGTTEVTYVYEEVKGNVVVKYVDKEGNEIKTPVNDETNVSTGTDYDTTDKIEEKITTQDGKTYKRVPSETKGNETGKVTEGTTEVTYVYEEVKGNVVVKYVDKEGNEIKTPVNDETNVSTGTDYNTIDNKPSTITTADGKTYKLVPSETKGNETGKVTEGTTEVTYVYEEVKGNVVVKYVDKEGNEIKTPVNDETNVSTGTDYNTTDKIEEKITTADGKTYKRVPSETKGNEIGKVVEGTTEVTYVYEEIKGNVVVKYVDKEGNVIKDPVTDTENASTGTDYDTTDKIEEKITTPDGKTYKLVPSETKGNETGKVVEGTTEVTYVYEEVKGNVVVKYVDKEGNEIKSPINDETNVSTGTDYDTTDKIEDKITTADGKTYKLVPSETKGNETGKVTEGTTEVTYVYEEVKGNVVVNYVDKEGNVIKEPVTDTENASTGTDYNTTDNKPSTITTADGKTYKLVPSETKGNETGKVTEGTTEVTYVYEEVKGNVVVKYVDKEGNEIKTPVNDETNVSTGTDYNTTDKIEEKITTADGKTYKRVPSETKGNETGKVTEGTTEVTYVYEEVKGNVVVKYVDKEGNEIKTPVNDETNVSTGTDYDTTDNKPSTITTDDGKTYKLVSAGTYTVGEVDEEGHLITSDSITGTITKEKTEVTYVYEEVKGSVVVNYVDKEGNVIKAPVTDTEKASTGTDYDTTDKIEEKITTLDGKTYKRVPSETKGNEIGKVVEGTTEVTYVYEEVKGNVVVNYVDKDGNVIKEPVTDTENTSTGTDYDTTDNKPETITTADGKTYKLVPSETKGNEIGKVTEGTTEVTYVYEEVKGNVVVNYVDKEGNVIKAPVTDTENASTGTDYDTTDKIEEKITTPDGKTYKRVPSETKGNETGKVTEGTTEVTYVYEEVKGTVVVKYVDKKGNIIKEPVTDTENASTGTDYDTTDKIEEKITTADGKTYKRVPSETKGNETGKVTEGTTEVTYVYEEVKGNVVVKYVDKEGNEIKTPVNDETNVSTGTDYDTTDNKPETITTADGKTYKLVPSETKGNEIGKVTEGTTEVTYVYEEVKGNVVVKYVDKEGNEIKTPVNDEINVSTGTDYDTTDKIEEKITTQDGKTYKRVPSETKGNETGKVTEGTTEVTYVYEEVKGNVVVNYVDKEGNVIKDPVTDTENASTGTDYNTTDNKPSTITTADGKTYKLVPSETKGNETGKVTEGTTEVTYVYEEVKGNVVVKYVDKEGNVIKDPVTDTENASTGTDYDTTDNKPNTITTTDGKKYYFIEVKDGDSETGKVVEGTTEVTYVYGKLGNYTPYIPTEPDKEIPKVPYDETPESPEDNPPLPYIKGYTPKDKDGNPLKPVDEKDPTKGYIPPGIIDPTDPSKNTPVPYEKDSEPEIKKGTVLVRYTDEKGNVIKEEVVNNSESPVGTDYRISVVNKPTTITFNGKTYELVPEKTVGDETGTIVEGETVVTYVYKEKVAPMPDPKPEAKKGTVVVKYVDESGNPIAKDVLDTPESPVGTAYTTVDNKPTTITLPDGKIYEIVPEKIDGNETGTIVEGETTVTYVYKEKVTPTPDPEPEEKKGTVVVRYTDEKGNVIKTEIVDTPESPVGTAYTTVDNKPTTITFNGKTYELVPEKTDGNETGKVVEGLTIITYVYKEKVVPTPDPKPEVEKGTVVVRYTDEKGNVIKTEVVDTPESPVGTDYDTTDNKPTIIEKDGKKYILVKVKDGDKEVGKVVSGTTVVTYIYKEITESPIAPPKQEDKVVPKVEDKSPTEDTKVENKVSRKLSNTGESSTSTTTATAGLLLLALAGLVGKRRNKK